MKQGLSSWRMPSPGPAGAATHTHRGKARLGLLSALGAPPPGWLLRRASTRTFLWPEQRPLSAAWQGLICLP